MKIPERIKLGGHEIEIKIAKVKDAGGAGNFNGYYNLITLRNEADTPEDNVSECLLHEIMEAIKYKNNLEIDHTHLTVLCESLFQVIRDNNLTFLKEGEK